jgi:DnaJ-class molecular chaperone
MEQYTSFMDYHNVLKLPPTATQHDIKKQFRKLSLEFHPDRGGDAATFTRIHEAYEHLMKTPPVQATGRVAEITLEQAYRGGPAPVFTPTETIYIDIPPGTDDNETISVGGGQYTVRVTNTSKFTRKGLNLYYTHTISLKEALCGFVLALDHLDGTTIRITKDNGDVVQPFQKKTIHHYGIRRGQHCGDLVVTFEVLLPTKVTEAQRKCVEECF